MPNYDFKCPSCEGIKIDVFLPITHHEADLPECCGAHMSYHITKAPYVAWQDRQLLDGGFKATHDGTVITSVKQNKEYMARNGLRLADEDYEPPTHAEEKALNAESMKAIDAITPTDRQMDIMKSDGTMDKIESMMKD